MRRRVLSSTSALVLLGLVLVTCDRADSPTKPPVPVASVVVAPARDTLAVGGTVQLTATPQDQGGTPLTGRAIT